MPPLRAASAIRWARGAQRDQLVRHLGRSQSHQFVALLFILPQLEHLAQDGDLASFHFFEQI